jgi:hypothetical protein
LAMKNLLFFKATQSAWPILQRSETKFNSSKTTR